MGGKHRYSPHLLILIVLAISIFIPTLGASNSSFERKVIGFNCNPTESFGITYEVEDLYEFDGKVIHQHTSKTDAEKEDKWWSIVAEQIAPQSAEEVGVEIATEIVLEIVTSTVPVVGQLIDLIELVQAFIDAEEAKNSDGTFDFFIFNGKIDGKYDWKFAGYISNEWWENPVAEVDNMQDVETTWLENIIPGYESPRYFYHNIADMVRKLPEKYKKKLHGKDLIIDILTVSNKTPVAGQYIYVEAVPKNLGCKPVELCLQGLYFDSEYGEPRVTKTRSTFIGRNSCYAPFSLGHGWPNGVDFMAGGIDVENWSAKNHTICALVDVEKEVDELNESNNLKCIGITVYPPTEKRGAELIAFEDEIETEPESFSGEQQIRVSGKVWNLGDVEANGFTVRATLDKDTTLFSVEKLNPDESLDFNFVGKTAATPETPLTIDIDPNDEVKEWNEDNNFLNLKLRNKQDLRVIEIVVEDEEGLRIGKRAKLKATVNRPVWDIDVPIYVSFWDEDDLISATNDSEPKGTELIFRANWTPPEVGKRVIKAIVDPGDLMDEGDEENNQLEKEVEVGGYVYDFDITCLRCYLLTTPGDKARFTILLKNTGNVEDTYEIEFIGTNLTHWGQPIIEPRTFSLQPGLAKMIDITIDIDQEVPNGEYYLKIKAKSLLSEEKKEKIEELLTDVQGNYKIFIWPVCHYGLCALPDAEEEKKKTIKPDEIAVYKFNIKNEGDPVELILIAYGEQNGYPCWSGECRFINVTPSTIYLDRNESKAVTLEVAGLLAGTYKISLGAESIGHGHIGDYQVTTVIKSAYKISYQVEEEVGEIDPFANWQYLGEIEVSNMGNSNVTVELAVVEKPEDWDISLTSSLPLESPSAGRGESVGTSTIGARFTRPGPVINEPLIGGEKKINISIKTPGETDYVILKPKVMEIHDIFVASWYGLTVVRADSFPISFFVQNIGNVPEDVEFTAKSEKGCEIDIFPKRVRVLPYSFNRKRSGCKSANLYVNTARLLPGEEDRIAISAISEHTNDTYTVKIKAAPGIDFRCEGLDYCSHSISPGKNTSYELRIINGYNSSINVSLNISVKEVHPQNWSYSMRDSFLEISPFGSNKTTLNVKAPDEKNGSIKIAVAVEMDNKRAEILSITNVKELSQTIYPGWTIISGPVTKCGNELCELGEDWKSCRQDCEPPLGVCDNGICESGENCQNCPQDCSCPEDELCCDGVCRKPYCTSDSDCEEAGICEIGKCRHPGTCDAVCRYYEISPCCGNEKCEEGEYYENCPEDCCEIGKIYPLGSECECPEGFVKQVFPDGSFECYPLP